MNDIKSARYAAGPCWTTFWRGLKNRKPGAAKSSFGQAIHYCLGQCDKLVDFLQDGRLELDNNRSERSIKPFVIGSKNWLFTNTQRGAKASAIVYSIVETAKENELNPFLYLSYLFEKLPNLDSHDEDTLDQLLPRSFFYPQLVGLIIKPPV